DLGAALAHRRPRPLRGRGREPRRERAPHAPRGDRGGDPRNGVRRLARGHDRLGGPRGAACRAAPRGRGLRAADAAFDPAGRGVQARGGYRVPHAFSHRGASRRRDRLRRHAGLHRAPRGGGAPAVTLGDRNIGFGFANRVVGEGFELDLAAREIVCLLGPNGSGKTTLLRTLLGLVAPLSGDVVLDGRPLAQWPIRGRASRLAYVPQAVASHFDYSVLETVQMG